MGGPGRSFLLDAGIAQSGKIHFVDESLTGAEQDRRYGDVKLIDSVAVKILLDDIDAAARARSSASAMPPVTKWKALPPCMTRDACTNCCSPCLPT